MFEVFFLPCVHEFFHPCLGSKSNDLKQIIINLFLFFVSDFLHILYCKTQCCGSGSGRIRTVLPDPEISTPNPDPDPALVVFKKISVAVQYRAYVYLFTP
jgi:hypothetical protein